jgi:ferric-dicitrate binding protein FerR (iron transport regulator)
VNPCRRPVIRRDLTGFPAAAVAAANGMDGFPYRPSGRAGLRSVRVRLVWGLAALAVVAILTGGVDPMRVHYYETTVGEHRTVGCRNSLVTLNPQSRVAIQCARNLLRADLLRGEASFRVAHDPSSTAIVRVGDDAEVEAFGATFSMRRDADRSTVRVIEGAVTLSALESLRTIQEMTVWAGEHAAVVEVNRGSQHLLRDANTADVPSLDRHCGNAPCTIAR